MAVTRVARQSVADQLFDQLLDGILAGDLPAGSQLPAERDLAAQAGVNRQAVREALQRLRQLDLVEIVHGGGVRVLDWRATAGLALLPPLLLRNGDDADPAVVRSTAELRVTVGAHAARRCAERSPGGTAISLRALVQEMELDGDDPFRSPALDAEFWDAVVTGADNIAYRLVFNTLRTVSRDLPVKHALPDAYRALAEAIAAGDAVTAESCARRLLG